MIFLENLRNTLYIFCLATKRENDQDLSESSDLLEEIQVTKRDSGRFRSGPARDIKGKEKEGVEGEK